MSLLLRLTGRCAACAMLSGNLVVPVEPVQLRAGRVRGLGYVEVRLRALQVPWLHCYLGGEENKHLLSIAECRGVACAPLPGYISP